MDTEWFKAQKKVAGVNDEAIGLEIRRDRSVVNRIISGKMPMGLEFVEGFARALNVSQQEILRRVGALPDQVTAERPARNGKLVKFEGASLEEPKDNLPVFGTGLGAAREIDGEAIEQTTLNTGSIIEYVKRPVILDRNHRDAYGLYVQGSSMHPALPDGEMVVVVKNAPLSVGDNVVVYLRSMDPEEDDGDRARAVLVKELVRRTARFVELRQYQPAKDFQISMNEVLRIDRVLTRREMLS